MNTNELVVKSFFFDLLSDLAVTRMAQAQEIEALQKANAEMAAKLAETEKKSDA